VQKSFSLDIRKGDIGEYQVKVFEPINTTFNLKLINSINKNPGNKVVNNKIGQIEGEVKLENGKKLKGFGIFEYIYH
jgi:hypothetical protein